MDLLATNTKLGWVLHGNTGQCRRVDSEVSFVSWSADDELHELVKRAFSVHDFGVKPAPLPRNKDDERALQLLSTMTHDGTRWQTGLLWRDDNPQLPES